MELYFENSKGDKIKISKCNTLNDIENEIRKFCKDRNFTIYYIRGWERDGCTIFDVGSHTEFFIVNKLIISGK